MKNLFSLVERCHIGLTDLFPHEVTKALGGTRTILRTPLLGALKLCIQDVRQELMNLPDADARNELASLWTEAANLLARMEKERDRSDADARIDNAATLLYLASGTTWNYLRELAPGESSHNPQYVTVEPILPLLKRCGRENAAETDPKQLAQRLIVELNACLR
jgi:hypothetical protein